MTTRVLLAVLILSAGAGAQQRAGKAPQARIPVVVELFTSEGCSSCPAADDLLASLAKGEQMSSQYEVIALGEHVDYWDNLGWKDSFSSPLFSARQQDYGIAFRSSNVYTPQMVVNGQKEVLGSDAAAIHGAIAATSRSARAEILMQVAAQDILQLRVGKLPPGSHKADVLLAVTESGIETYVSAGENQSRHLRHTAVVRLMSKLAELDPAHPGEYTADARLNLRPEWKRSNVRLVLLLQDKENRRILGAASLPLVKESAVSSSRVK